MIALPVRSTSTRSKTRASTSSTSGPVALSPSSSNCRELEDVATDQQTGGLATSLNIDRITASRLGIAPTTIDNTLYDAFGQRQISTMYTQLNQYHVILETQPQFQLDPCSSERYLYSGERLGRSASGTGALPRASPRQVPRLRARPHSRQACSTRPPAASLLHLPMRFRSPARAPLRRRPAPIP